MHVKPISLSLALASLLLAGCNSTGTPEEHAVAAPVAESSSSAAAPSFSGRCDASVLTSLVGKVINSALSDQAKLQAGAETVRVLRPHDPVTMDYNSRRLNIDIDDAGMIKQFSCG